MPSRRIPEVQLDFVVRRDGTGFRPRTKPSEVTRSQESALTRTKKEAERVYRRGIDAPLGVIDTKRIISFNSEGQPNSAAAVLIQKDPKTKELRVWAYRGCTPGNMQVEWDQHIMLICHLEEHPNLKEWAAGPAIDLRATFEDMRHLEGGEGFLVKHGGIVFDPKRPKHGIYQRFTPFSEKLARLVGIPQ